MDNEIIITVETLLKALGVIITLGGATAVISRWLSPFKALRQSVENKATKAEFNELKKQVDILASYQNGDHERLKSVETGNEKICKGILAIMDHELTGNSVDKLRKTKDELQNYLIEK